MYSFYLIICKLEYLLRKRMCWFQTFHLKELKIYTSIPILHPRQNNVPETTLGLISHTKFTSATSVTNIVEHDILGQSTLWLYVFIICCIYQNKKSIFCAFSSKRL